MGVKVGFFETLGKGSRGILLLSPSWPRFFGEVMGYFCLPSLSKNPSQKYVQD
jgi:hypothetical protein